MYNLVGLGGTFDHFHAGHMALLQNAFNIGEHVAIAISTEKLLGSKVHQGLIESYDIRKQNLVKFIEQTLKISSVRYSLIPLNDPFGPAITDPDLQVHISSMETYPGSLKINELRIKNGLDPLIIVIIPLILNENGQKLSSTEIRTSLSKLQ